LPGGALARFRHVQSVTRAFLIDRLKPEGGPRRTPGPGGAASELGPLVLAVFGPTASGKTGVAEALAERVPAELVSADSMQVYRGLPILTNQPERPTRLVGSWPLDHQASVAEYAHLAHAAVDEILETGRTPIVVGGTGLYLRAALAELELPPAPPHGARARWERVYDRLGSDVAHAALAERDPAAAEVVHPNDRRRVVRALELHEAGGSLRPPRDRLWSAETRHPTLVVGLEVPREVLSARIEKRARALWERGVEEEVERALTRPLSATARQVIGLHEVATLPREEATAAIISRTRQYAAYQRKWMRRIPGIVSLAADRPPGDVADEILEVARARQRLPARRAD
jgi:tRNA dimethylallyltransferase